MGGHSVDYYSIPVVYVTGLGAFCKLPAAIKVVLENILWFEVGGITLSFT